MRLNVGAILRYNSFFAKKFEQFSMPMCKQIPGVEKCITNDKVLVRAWRTSLKLDVETKMFKYVQRFPFS